MLELFNGLLVSCPNSGGLFYLRRGNAIRLDGLDTTGLAVSGGLMLRGLQPGTAHLIGHKRESFFTRPVVVEDVHDVLIGEDVLYVVGTWGNEIVKFDKDGNELERHVFPGEQDAWHINCLASFRGRTIFSAFGDHREHRGYKQDPEASAFVQDLVSGEKLISGLSQPHSLTPFGAHLLLANSYLCEIREYDSDFNLIRTKKMDGYTRGLLIRDGFVYVGLSRSRNLEVGAAPGATIVALDAATWEEVGRLALPIAEIYDILKPTNEDLIDSLAGNASLAWDHMAQRLAEKQSELSQLQGALEEQQVANREIEIRSEKALKELKVTTEQLQQTAYRLEGTEATLQIKSAELQNVEATLFATTERLERVTAELHDKDTKLESLAEESQELKNLVVLWENSLSWRLTRPLRIGNALRQRFLQGLGRAGSGLKYVLKDSGSRRKYLRLARQLGALETARHALRLLRRGEGSPEPGVVLEHKFDLRNATGLPVTILCTLHCRFIGVAISDALRKVGIKARIIHAVPDDGFDNAPHFVLCPQMFDVLPELYVAFQMEQSVSSRWFTDDYLRRLENSFAVFDYSLENIGKLVSMGLHSKQFFYMPVAYLPGYGADLPPVEESYDVLFYGDINNERRRACIHELEKVCRVKVVSNLFGRDMLVELRKAKVVVNIHYYPGALLESTRLWECLSLGRLVVSERGSDMARHEDLLPLVDFVDEGDFRAMADRVRHWLEHEDLRRDKLAANAGCTDSLFNRFHYFFYRFLLATDNIGFEEFWRLIGEDFPLASDRLCLNLPEYIERSESFDRDNRFGFQRFPGLRHAKGWLGCAMSYKYMLRLAQKHGLPSITICEDDVEFPADFEATWKVVQEALAREAPRWDVFSGVLADLSGDTEVLAVESINGRYFVLLDRLISMVFNVYNSSCYELIDSWDERIQDVLTNTIDRFLEREGNLRVMTTSPFLVGHKEELHSTLWGGQNTIYKELIKKSAALLDSKIGSWRRGRAQE